MAYFNEDILEIEYHDGKPVKKKVDPMEEIYKELLPKKDRNPADSIKSALYGDLPKAQQKRDRSITARDLNVYLETKFD